MMEDLKRLVKDVISSKRVELDNINDAMLKKIDELISQLSNNITGVNVELFREIMEYINKDNTNYRVDSDIGQILIVKFFSEHNDSLSSRYKINSEQHEYVIDVIKRLEEQRVIEQSNLKKRILLGNEIEMYAEFLSKLVKNEEFIDDLDLLNSIFEEGQVDYSVRYMLLADIFQNNVKLFERENSKDNNLKIDNATKEKLLVELFEKYAFDFYDFDEEFRRQFIDKGDLVNIEDMIKVLIPYRNIMPNDNTLPILLLYSRPELFNDIKNVSINCKIPFKNLLARPSIFIDRVQNDENYEVELDVHRPVPSFNRFLNIYKEVSDLGFDYGEILESGIFDKGDENVIFSNLRLIRTYKIPEASKRINRKYSYSSFAFRDIFDIFDKYVELGLYNYARYNISGIRANHPVKIKYALSKKLNIIGFETRKDNLSVQTVRNSVLKTDIPYSVKELEEAYIKPSKLIPNAKEYSKVLKGRVCSSINPSILDINTALGKLEEYVTSDGMAYNIDGLLISRNKVLRLFTALTDNGYSDSSALLYAVTYNSYLTDEEFYKIQNKIVLLSSSLDRGGR